MHRLLRLETPEKREWVNGDNVGDGELEDTGAGIGCSPPTPAPPSNDSLRKCVDSPTATQLQKEALGCDSHLVRRHQEVTKKIAELLGKKRGVVSGLPLMPGLSNRPSERVLALNTHTAAGQAHWWLNWLSKTPASKRDSRITRTDANGRDRRFQYRIAGEPSRAFDWWPTGAQWGVEKGKINAFLHYGVTVHINTHGVQPSMNRYVEPTIDAQVTAHSTSIFIEAEAATHEIAPAVFAATLVHSADDYEAARHLNPESELCVTGDAISPEVAVASGASKRVSASVVISQIHTFTLHDMLRAYSAASPEENLAAARASIKDAVKETIGVKVKKLADLSILKLNMSPSTIAFVPHLEEDSGEFGDLGEEDEDGEWILNGHSFYTRRFDPVAGVPRLLDYDNRICKRLDTTESAVNNCSRVLMSSILLASVKAQFPAAHGLVLEAMLEVPDFALSFESAWNSLALDTFSAAYLKTFQHSRIEREPLPKTMFGETIDDFATLTQDAHKLGIQPALEKAEYSRLVCHILEARQGAKGLGIEGVTDISAHTDAQAEALCEHRIRLAQRMQKAARAQNLKS